MGSKSKRFPASEIVNFDVGYMVWLVILLLGFRIRPADYGNVFQYTNPGASVFETWMSEVIAIANTPIRNFDYYRFSNTSISHIESYHLEQEAEREVIDMSKFANNSYQKIGNYSSKAMHLPLPEDLNFSEFRFLDLSKLLGMAGPEPLYVNASELSQWRLRYAYKKCDSNLQGGSSWNMILEDVLGRIQRKLWQFSNGKYAQMPIRSVCFRFVASDMKQIEVVRVNRNHEGTSTESALIFAYNAIYLDTYENTPLEFDKVGTPKEDLVSYFLTATSVQEEELRFLSYKKVEDANGNSIIQLHGSPIIQLHGFIENNNTVRHIQEFACCGACDAQSNNVGTSRNKSLKLRTKVVSVVFCSIIIFVIILKMAWKRKKKLTLFKLNNELDALILDESYHTDQILYENLLKEATLVSEGSSGKVYKVMFLDLECAMKVFNSNARMDFRKESITLTNLSHPHIVNYFCCFRKSFILMELMDEDLFTFINKIRERQINYDMPLEVAVDIMLQIAEGMSYLHNQGIAHQDLKSLNILLKLRGEFHDPNFQIVAKVADFGSARGFDPRHPARRFVLLPNMNFGTRLWRAPELFHSKRGFLTRFFGIHPKIMPKPLDIYGFAIICSELITKQIPFSNDEDLRVAVFATKIRNGHRPALPSADECPERLTALIMDCWHRDPRLRPEFNEIRERLIEVKSSWTRP